MKPFKMLFDIVCLILGAMAGSVVILLIAFTTATVFVTAFFSLVGIPMS